MKAVVVAVYEEARAAVMHYSGSVKSAEDVLNKNIAHFNDIRTQQRMFDSFQQMNFPPEVEAKLLLPKFELLIIPANLCQRMDNTFDKSVLSEGVYQVVRDLSLLERL